MVFIIVSYFRDCFLFHLVMLKLTWCFATSVFTNVVMIINLAWLYATNITTQLGHGRSLCWVYSWILPPGKIQPRPSRSPYCSWALLLPLRPYFVTAWCCHIHVTLICHMCTLWILCHLHLLSVTPLIYNCGTCGN